MPGPYDAMMCEQRPKDYQIARANTRVNPSPPEHEGVKEGGLRFTTTVWGGRVRLFMMPNHPGSEEEDAPQYIPAMFNWEAVKLQGRDMMAGTLKAEEELDPESHAAKAAVHYREAIAV